MHACLHLKEIQSSEHVNESYDSSWAFEYCQLSIGLPSRWGNAELMGQSWHEVFPVLFWTTFTALHQRNLHSQREAVFQMTSRDLMTSNAASGSARKPKIHYIMKPNSPKGSWIPLWQTILLVENLQKTSHLCIMTPEIQNESPSGGQYCISFIRQRKQRCLFRRKQSIFWLTSVKYIPYIGQVPLLRTSLVTTFRL